MARGALEGYVLWCLKRGRPNSKTVASYRRVLGALAAFADEEGRGALEDLEEEDLLAFLKSLGDARPGTQHVRLAAIRGFYGYLVETGRRKVNPAKDLRQIGGHKGRPRPRAGQLARKISRLGPTERQIVNFVRSLDPRVPLTHAFRIDEDPPVGEEVYVPNRRTPIRLKERERKILDQLGGRFPYKWRTFERRLEDVGLTPSQIRLGSRTTIQVELSPDLEELVHSNVAHEEYEAAADKVFRQLEVRLRELTGTEMWGERLIDRALSDSGVLTAAFSRPEDRRAVRQLFLGAFDYFRNPMAHSPVYFDDPIYAREVVLIGDLLMRILDAATLGRRSPSPPEAGGRT